MKFRQILGYAFKHWSKADCEHMIEMGIAAKEYKLGARIATYILAKKF